MDRFLFQLHVAFPNKEQLLKIVELTTGAEQALPQKVCDGETLLQMGEIAKQVPVAKPVAEYSMDLILQTHPDYEKAPEAVKKYVRYGASPRGAQAVMMASKVYALLDGRYHVAYKDVAEAAKPVLRHRVFLNFEGIAEGLTADDVIDMILNEGRNGKAE